ncbi:THAP7 protein, partial [Upupa epops]|nr:THAP7 protein [Upupa epops]
PTPRSLPQRDSGRRAQWLQNSRRRDPSGRGCWDPTSKYIYFCSQHFDKSCFEIVSFSGYHRLKEGAVPTVFGSTPPRSPRNPKLRPSLADGNTPNHPGTPRRWRVGDTPSPPTPGDPQFMADVSCFPNDSEDPTAPPAGDHGGVPALPGLLGARGTFVDNKEGGGGAPQPPLMTSILSPVVPQALAACPPSPSLFMLRLPTAAASYIQSEHSYQVGSALLWKR